jgi:hypothetical protein
MSSRLLSRSVTILGAVALTVVPMIPLADEASAGSREDSGPYAPYENLVEVLADFSRHLGDDLYRFPPPRDIVGEPLFDVTLERLDNFRTLHPGEMSDVLDFARAEAFLRLGRYAAAARTFGRVGALDSPLAELARSREATATEIARVHVLPEDGPTLEERLKRSKKKLEAWDRIIDETRGTAHESICRREEERLEARLLTLIIDNRSWIADGDETAVRSATFLIAKHVESQQAPSHVIRLGDLHTSLAQDYVARHAYADFDQTAFNDHVAQGLEAYARIASLDGVPEKLEADAKLAALKAYRNTVLAARW